MFWIFVIATVVCIELAGWLVDATFLVRLHDDQPAGQVDEP